MPLKIQTLDSTDSSAININLQEVLNTPVSSYKHLLTKKGFLFCFDFVFGSLVMGSVTRADLKLRM